jgi:hypothetical protein
VGQIAVYDATNTAFGWIGRNGSDYGAWFKTLGLGGSGVSTARIKTDASGNVTISMTAADSFSITNTGNSNRFIVNPADVTFEETSSSAKVSILVGGVTAYSPDGSKTSTMGANNTTGFLQVNGNTVVAARKTGWTAPTGTASRAGFATSTATLTQVAETLKALIDDLHFTSGHGLIGS